MSRFVIRHLFQQVRNETAPKAQGSGHIALVRAHVSAPTNGIGFGNLTFCFWFERFDYIVPWKRTRRPIVCYVYRVKLGFNGTYVLFSKMAPLEFACD